MGDPERDLYKTATTVGGLPTCTFPAASYNRVITNIVVNNSVTSTVRVYRGLLGSTPIAQSTLGFNNTLKGRLAIPAGQQFFVQWSAAGSPVSSAFARVSSERESGPFSGSSAQVEWTEESLSSFTVPTGGGGGRIVLSGGSDVPAELVAYYTTNYSITVVATIQQFKSDGIDYEYSCTFATGTTYIRATGWVTSVAGVLTVSEKTIETSPVIPFFRGIVEYRSAVAGREPFVKITSQARLYVNNNVEAANNVVMIPHYVGIATGIGPNVGTWVNLGLPTVSYTQIYNDTTTEFTVYGGGYAAVAGVLELELGLNFNDGAGFNQTFGAAAFYFNTANEHNHTGGVSELPAGTLVGPKTYTVSLMARLRQGDGVNICTVDNQDRFSAVIRESHS